MLHVQTATVDFCHAYYRDASGEALLVIAKGTPLRHVVELVARYRSDAEPVVLRVEAA